MSADAIKAALDAACRAFCFADGECPCVEPDACGIGADRGDIAAAVAAFLRALPANRALLIGKRGDVVALSPHAYEHLAAAVEEAARDG